MKPNILSVHQINQYIKALLENDMILNDIFVEAEISNFKHHSSGHMYFTLKDDYAAINCVIFKSYADSLVFKPKNGMKVLVYGRVSLYEKTGQYQLYGEFMEPSGKGALYLAFEQLRDKLKNEGLFDLSLKKEIPPFPTRVAIVTSSTGAAVRDIIQVAKRRNPSVELVVYPVSVQGEKAVGEIVRALKNLNQWGKADTIILGRGGGSIEDLWAFNEEAVARAIFKSKIPIISAVGHETDTTISDFVADFRAPTPSAAAELAVPSLSLLRDNLSLSMNRLSSAMAAVLSAKQSSLEYLKNNRVLRHPLDRIYDKQIYLEQLLKTLNKEMTQKLAQHRMLLQNKISIMESISPLAILKRGYSLVYDEKGAILTSATNISENQLLKIKLHDGEIKVKSLQTEGR